MSTPLEKMKEIIAAKKLETNRWNIWTNHKINCKDCIVPPHHCFEGYDLKQAWEEALHSLRKYLD